MFRRDWTGQTLQESDESVSARANAGARLDRCADTRVTAKNFKKVRHNNPMGELAHFPVRSRPAASRPLDFAYAAGLKGTLVATEAHSRGAVEVASWPLFEHYLLSAAGPALGALEEEGEPLIRQALAQVCVARKRLRPSAMARRGGGLPTRATTIESAHRYAHRCVMRFQRLKEAPVWQMSLPWWEFAARGLIVYVFLMVLLRITGRRQVGQLAPFDLVLLLVLSNALQNSMNGGDNSVSGGVISALTLVGVNWLVGYVTFRSKRLARVVEGRPEVLVHNGHVYRDVLERERLTQSELDAAVRLAGCASIEDVHFAILENNGQISVRMKGH